MFYKFVFLQTLSRQGIAETSFALFRLSDNVRFVVCVSCYSPVLRRMTLADVLSIPGMVSPILAPMNVGSHTM